MKNTKQVPRRSIHLASYDALVVEAQRLVENEATGTGNWTLGEAIDHVAKGVAMSVEGSSLKAPLLMRIMGRMMKNRAIAKGFGPGIKPPGIFAAAFAPEPGVRGDEALNRLRRDVGAAQQAPEGRASPMFGVMTNDQWEQFQCRHAELHFGFFDVPGQTRDDAA